MATKSHDVHHNGYNTRSHPRAEGKVGHHDRAKTKPEPDETQSCSNIYALVVSQPSFSEWQWRQCVLIYYVVKAGIDKEAILPPFVQTTEVTKNRTPPFTDQ